VSNPADLKGNPWPPPISIKTLELQLQNE